MPTATVSGSSLGGQGTADRISGFPVERGEIRTDRPRPLPKRPKGRLFVGFLLIALLLGIGYVIWDTIFRYQVFGTVEGRVIRVAPVCDGLVTAVHVEEGQAVRQGQPLVTLENLKLEHELERLSDELNVARAALDAELAMLRLSLQIEGDRRHKALADLYELAGGLLKEKATLADLELKHRRLELLFEDKAVPESDYDSARLAETGQRAKVDKLCDALEELEQRAAATGTKPDLGYGQLKPALARVESLQNQIVRTRDQLARCEIKSPVNGLIVKRHFLPGEYIDASEPAIEVLEEGSLHAVVFFPADKTALLVPGQRLRLAISGSPASVEGVVTRTGSRLEPVPPVLASRYRRHENVLPVYLRPESRDESIHLQLGGIVQVPYWQPHLPTSSDHSQ